MTRIPRLIGYACGLGAPDARCAEGPLRLKSLGIEQRLQGAAWDAMLVPPPTPDPAPIETLAQTCDRLAARVQAVVAADGFPVVLGGDHTCAMGTWSGMRRALGKQGALGLLWIDAHLDAHTPQTTPSGAWHGMPLAALLGQVESQFAQYGGIAPQHVCVVGARSYEPEEAALLLRLGVRVFGMEEIRRRGLADVMDEALALVSRDTAAFGLTLDLDALDPADAPGVTTPAQSGLRAPELCAALGRLAREPALCAVEIAEFNPATDQDGRTAQLVEELLAAVLDSGAQRHDPAELERRYGARNYAPLPVTLVRGEGAWLWDEDGRRYLDMMAAYSAVSHGHAHPRLVRSLQRQSARLTMTSRAFRTDRLGPFLARLCELTGMDRALPANTGLEAVEAALKAARKWAYKVKGVPEDRAEIIACAGNFHGRSIAIVAMSSEAQYRDGFGPYPPGFHLIPYGDAKALERAITPHTAAFLVEPIQGEAGIRVPPAGYLAACADICRRHNVLLICDEVQTGLGRTGRFLACEHEGVKPDGLTLGKALGGGLLPVSAFLAREDVMAVFTPGDHGSTFGGNPLAATVALEALNLLVEEQLPERAAELGRHLLAGLAAIRSPLVTDVRGRGLFVGLELNPALASARALCVKLLEHGVLTKDTHETVVRFAPPLIVTREQLDFGIEAVRKALAELGSGVRRVA